jgi:hypothetical protein
MNMKKSTWFFYLPLLMAYTLQAQSTDSILVAALQSNSFSLQINPAGFTGDGASILREAISTPQFLLVGEQHGIVEAATFTEALFKEGITHQFQYLCIETDPFIAAQLEKVIHQPHDSITAFFRAFPLGVPFYNTKEDFQLLQTAVDLSTANGNILWGVDQVFMGGSRFIFYRLAHMASNPQAGELALQYHQKALAAYTETMESGNFEKLFLNQINDGDFSKLYDAFGNDPTDEAVRMITGLKESQMIYSLWMKGQQYDNNFTRVRLIKRQFMEYYRATLEKTELPKVVFRFGATHTYRGLSMYDQFDLGNLVSELAEMNGSHAVNFKITGIKGFAQGPIGPAMAFDNTNDIHPVILQALANRNDSGNWILLDLRPLRKLNPGQTRTIREIIHSYDFWIMVPEAKPVTMINTN